MSAAPRRPTFTGSLALLGLLALAPGCADEAPTADSAGVLAGKNVVVVLLDATATGHLDFHGYERATTPFLSGLAREGWNFTDVTAPAPYTIASVASLMTGEAVDLHGVTAAGEVVADELMMLAERFGAAGYRTGAFSANAHVQRKFGFGRGFEVFDGYWPKLDRVHEVPGEQRDAVREFLDAARDDPRPFFAYVHLLPPHAPYDPPATERAAFAPELAGTPLDAAGSIANLTPLSHGARTPAPAEAQAIEDLYDGALLHVDRVLAGLDLELSEYGLSDDTLLIVLSDHGEAFGEHGLWQHARTVFEEMVRVPLVVRLPADAPWPAAGSVEAPVGLVDVVPTLMELFALGGPAPYTGESLVPFFGGAEGVPRAVPLVTRTAGPGEHVAIRVGDHKLIHVDAKQPSWSLFDLAADPGERAAVRQANQAPSPELERAFRELRAQLKRTREELRARAHATGAAEVDAATQAELDAIGY